MLSSKTLISFDYAIKYLLRHKGDYDIIEGFISALLATQGYAPVKINALLESESNRESSDLKRSIADLVVEDKEGHKYIVEIERSATTNFMHKACFNSARLVVDSIHGDQDYTTIKKVFHISLLYFSMRDMTKPIYHGKTILHEIDTAHPVDVRMMNQGCQFFKQKSIFPEYFFISVPLFDDVIHQEIDEWLYMMKHTEVKEDFKSPYMQKVKERLAVLKMSDAERVDYYRYMKEAITYEDALTTAEEKGERKGMEKGIAKGMKKGMEKGMEKGLLQVAHNMLAEGMPLETVLKLTGLPRTKLQTESKEQA